MFPNQDLQQKSINHIPRYCNFLAATPAKFLFSKKLEYWFFFVLFEIYFRKDDIALNIDMKNQHFIYKK
jgi:hypothetical protein